MKVLNYSLPIDVTIIEKEISEYIDQGYIYMFHQYIPESKQLIIFLHKYSTTIFTRPHTLYRWMYNELYDQGDI
jgi:hypothetical protein